MLLKAMTTTTTTWTRMTMVIMKMLWTRMTMVIMKTVWAMIVEEDDDIDDNIDEMDYDDDQRIQ